MNDQRKIWEQAALRQSSTDLFVRLFVHDSSWNLVLWISRCLSPAICRQEAAEGSHAAQLQTHVSCFIFLAPRRHLHTHPS